MILALPRTKQVNFAELVEFNPRSKWFNISDLTLCPTSDIANLQKPIISIENFITVKYQFKQFINEWEMIK